MAKQPTKPQPTKKPQKPQPPKPRHVPLRKDSPSKKPDWGGTPPVRKKT